MATNFPNSPSNGATHTFGGRTYTYSSSLGAWTTIASGETPAITSDGATPSLSSGITGAEVRTLISAQQSGVGTTAVVANVAALPGSASTGDMAFVTGTNRLYLWNGSGWYNIALINTTPSISGVSASYNLAIDGTATTVTITATDPEGLPITYSIVSDTSGNTATVTQGTGASTNVFTITPSTNTAHAGTFSLTFRASDGVNIASAAASFTLQFQVVNQKYTTGLITSVGANNAVNTTFDDKSSSNHTITANGDAHQTTFSPYRHGGYSMEFDGTGDWIDTPNHADFDLDGEFTIEFWVYIPGSYARTVQRVIAPNSSGYGTAPYISIGNDTGITGGPAMSGVLCATRAVGAGNPQMHANQTGTSATGTATLIPLDTWTHCALTRDSSNVCRLFQGGTLVATNTDTNDFDFTYGNTVGARIGRSGWGTGETLGPANLKDFRIIKGTCLYTSNFTVPTETLTAVTNTKLLIFNKPYLKDEGETGHALTVSGDPTMAPSGPFDEQEYAADVHGGSAHFDGAGDVITVADHADLDGFSGDFTIEFWFYPTSSGDWRTLITKGTAATTGPYLIYQRNANINVYLSSNGSSHDIAGGTTVSTGGIKLNNWHHFALARNGNSYRSFLNGKLVNTITSSSGLVANAQNIGIGAANNAAEPFTGSIADVRIVNGTAVYTADFTPPTAPLTAITNTKLLVQSTDAGIIDKAQTANFVSLNGGTKSSTTQNKYLTSSMYFDGVDDTITVPQIDIKAGQDFTIECWHYLTSRTDSYPALFGNYSTWGTGGLGLFADHSSYSGGYQVAHNGTFPFLNIGTVTYNQWVHVALVRNGTTMTLYVDGTSAGSGTSGSVALPGVGTSFMIGRSSDNADGHIQGYLSDFRITQGLARYTSNFTAPTAALKG